MLKRWKIIEISLLLGLAVTFLWGAWSLQTQDDLGRKMIRLHVIANSDTEEDQTLKLRVRDQVLASATDILEQAADREEAQVLLQQALPEIQEEAASEIRSQGYDYAVTASVEGTEFPTKVYDGFSLPAGHYTALRVVIGEGKGHNWWCVVYPPLCTTAATDLEETAISDGMKEDDLNLMTGESDRYVLKFRSVELWEQFRQWVESKRS